MYTCLTYVNVIIFMKEIKMDKDQEVGVENEKDSKEALFGGLIDENYQDDKWDFWSLPSLVDETGTFATPMSVRKPTGTMEDWRGLIKFKVNKIVIGDLSGSTLEATIDYDYEMVQGDEVSGIKFGDSNPHEEQVLERLEQAFTYLVNEALRQGLKLLKEKRSPKQVIKKK